MKRTIANLILLCIAILSLLANTLQAFSTKLNAVSLGWILIPLFVLLISLVALAVGPRNYLREIYQFLFREPRSSFIKGEDKVIEALIEASRRAKKHIRTSRYFPHPINDRHPEYITSLRDALHSGRLKHHLSRVIACNNADKLFDIEDCIRQFAGKPATIYLTEFDHTFDMVTIDDKEAFLHFYGREPVVSASLHIRDPEVTERLIKVYDYLKDDSEDVIHAIKCSHLKTPADIQNATEKATRFFHRHFDPSITAEQADPSNGG